MNTTILAIAIYLAICCMCASTYSDKAAAEFKKYGPISGVIVLLVIFLIFPIVALCYIPKEIVKAFRKNKKSKEKKEPITKEVLILGMIRERLGLKEGDFFRFDNQNHDDIYYFSRTALKKIQWGHIRESNVSLNWILNRECKITKLTPDDVKVYLNTYPRVMGEKIE